MVVLLPIQLAVEIAALRQVPLSINLRQGRPLDVARDRCAQGYIFDNYVIFRSCHCSAMGLLWNAASYVGKTRFFRVSGYI